MVVSTTLFSLVQIYMAILNYNESLKMKILHVYRSYYPDTSGGIEESLRQIILSTSNQNIQSRIFTLSEKPWPKKIIEPNVTIYRYKSWIAPASCNIGGFKSFKGFIELAEWADIIHYHYPWPFGDLLHLISGIKKPALLTYHSDIVRQKFLFNFYKPLMKKLLKKMHFIVATSPNYYNTSITLNDPIYHKNIKIIPLGINEISYTKKNSDNILKKFGIKKNEIFFLFLGVIRYYKGIDVLIEAASLSNTKIVIAGSLPKQKELPNRFKKLRNQNIIFTGYVNDIEKEHLLKNCLAVVLPSHLRSEAFGMVLVEASMHGKPMITCEIGTGTSFVNINGLTGIVVPPRKPESIAEAIEKLKANPPLVNKFGKAARIRYEKKFSGLKLGNAYKNLYESILKL